MTFHVDKSRSTGDWDVVNGKVLLDFGSNGVMDFRIRGTSLVRDDGMLDMTSRL